VVEQGAQVVGKISAMFPVLRLGIVGAEREDDRLRVKSGQVIKLPELPIGQVSLPEQGRAADAEIADLEPGAEQFAEDDRVAIGFAVLDTRAEGDAVAHAGDTDDASIIRSAERRPARHAGAAGQ